MHPAPSIIVFTTLSGLGFGLIACIGIGLLPPPAFLPGAVLAVALSGAGLCASLFHLGHPERAWRALSQWRSSWLSREGVLALATLAIFAAHAGARTFLGVEAAMLGLAAAALALLTVYATAMIYASLRAVPTWTDPMTVPCYLAFAAAGGSLLAALLARLAGAGDVGLEALATLLLAVAWGLKALWWRSALARGYGASRAETATGLGGIGRVRLFEAPHTAANYLMKEMVFRVGRRHAAKLRALALGLGGAVPLAALGLSIALGGAVVALILGVAAHYLGLLAERWLFFAEARHTVALYYGARPGAA